MRKIGLVIVGDGVLNGDFVDGASTNVVAAMEEQGYEVSGIEITGNSSSQVEKGVKNLIQNPDIEIVITVGALGVDLRGHNHRSGVAHALGTELAYFPELKDHLSKFSNKDALDAHAVQSQHSLGFETGATVPLFINYSPFDGTHVVSLSGWADLLDRQIQSLIANAIPPKPKDEKHHVQTPDDYPIIFNSRNPLSRPQISPHDADIRDKFAKIQEAIAANDDFVDEIDGVHIIFDMRDYSPQRYAYLAAFLSANDVCISTARAGDPNQLVSEIPTGHAIVVLSDDNLDIFFQSEVQRVSAESPESLTSIDTDQLPKAYRMTIKTQVELDEVDTGLRGIVALQDLNCNVYVSVPNLDDPTTGAVIEVRTSSRSDLTYAFEIIEQLGADKNWRIQNPPDVGKKSNGISTEGWDVPYSASALMASPQKLLTPLPDSLSLRFHDLITRQDEFAGTEEPQNLVNELEKIFIEQNTPGKYEFDVYEGSLGMLRPVALIAINELCVAYDLDLPEIVSPENFGKASELVEQVRPVQIRLIASADQPQILDIDFR